MERNVPNVFNKKIKVGPRTKKSKMRKYFRIKKYFRKMNHYGINKSIL